MAYIGKTPSQAVRQRYYYTASGSETSLSGADDNSNTLAFSDGEYVDVSLNGVSLVAGTDYNTNTANTIAGLSALSVNDIVEIVVYDTFSVHSGTFEGSSTFNGDATVDNIKIDGNTISSTDTNGNVNITPNGSGKVKVDNLSIDGNTIAAEDTDGDLILSANGTGDVEVNLASEGSVLNVNYTNSNSGEGPVLRLNRTSASPADGDELGEIVFSGNDSVGNVDTYATITAEAPDVTGASEDGQLKFFVRGTSSTTGNYKTMSLRSASGTPYLTFGSNVILHWNEWGGLSTDGDLYLRPYSAQNGSEVNTSRTIELPDGSGLLSYVEQHRTVVSDATEVDFDNLSSTFETYVFKYRLHPVSNNDYLKIQFLDSSGTVISGATDYGMTRMLNGSHIGSNDTSGIPISSGAIGSSSHEGIRGELVLLGINYVNNDADSSPPVILGQHSYINGSGNFVGGTIQGGLKPSSQQAIRGIRFSFNTGNIDSGVISIAGIQEAI